jgi:hypothetical protein
MGAQLGLSHLAKATVLEFDAEEEWRKIHVSVWAVSVAVNAFLTC